MPRAARMLVRGVACPLILLLVLSGCGHVNFEHEVEIHLENFPAGAALDDFQVYFDHIFIRRPSEDGEVHPRGGIHRPDRDGVVRFRHRHGTTAVFGQTGPGRLGFNLYLPGVTTDGWYRMHLRRTFRARTQDVEGRFVPFARLPEGASVESGPLPVRGRLAPRRPEERGGPSGYHVTVWIDVSGLPTSP